MKKDGIQTRNRKMSTKSKKKGRNGSMCDLLKPLDKPFSSFSSNLSPAMHSMNMNMNPYMPSSGLGGSFMPSHQPQHQGGGLGTHNFNLHQGMGMGMGMGMGSSLGSGLGSSLSTFSSSIPTSGLNLSTNSSMVGAMA